MHVPTLHVYIYISDSLKRLIESYYYHSRIALSLICHFSHRGCRRCLTKVLVLAVFIVIAILVLMLFFGLYNGTDAHRLSTSKGYTLMCNVILSYNHLFCQGLQAASLPTGVPYDKTLNGTLYLLNSLPLLTGQYSINLYESSFLDQATHTAHWNFHLNKGSNASFEFCYNAYDPKTFSVKFYLIRGSDQHLKWISKPGSSKFALEVIDLNARCQNKSYNNMQHDDIYYFYFYSSSYSDELEFNIAFKVNLTIYNISSDSIIQNCSFPLNGHSNCSISTPMSSSSVAVLSLNSSSTTFDHTVDIKITCVPRVWLYVVTALCSLLFIIFITVVMLVCMCVALWKRTRGRNMYYPINEDDAVMNAAVAPAAAGPMAGSEAPL